MLSHKIIFTSLALLVFASCSGKRFEYARTTASTDGGNGAQSGPVEVMFGGGVAVEGKGNFSVPSAEAVVARIQNGLDNNVKVSAGNFKLSFTAVQKNLPQTTDPTKATGYDQIQLLVYGACSDLTTGTTPLMQSKYGVQKAMTIAQNKTALIAAGMKMIDNYSAGIASASVATSKIQAALDTMLTAIVAKDSTSTSTMGFMAVCIAANTAGSSMLGF